MGNSILWLKRMEFIWKMWGNFSLLKLVIYTDFSLLDVVMVFAKWFEIVVKTDKGVKWKGDVTFSALFFKLNANICPLFVSRICTGILLLLFLLYWFFSFKKFSEIRDNIYLYTKHASRSSLNLEMWLRRGGGVE